MKFYTVLLTVVSATIFSTAQASSISASIGYALTGDPLYTSQGAIGTGRYGQVRAQASPSGSNSMSASASLSWSILLVYNGVGAPPTTVSLSWHRIDKADLQWFQAPPFSGEPATGQLTGRGKARDLDTGLKTINQNTDYQSATEHHSSGSINGSITAYPAWYTEGGVWKASAVAISNTQLQSSASYTNPQSSTARKEDGMWVWSWEEFYIDSAS